MTTAWKSTSWKTYNERHKVLVRAQELARSGQHISHETIIPELTAMEGFVAARPRLEERATRTQLDRLCAMAQDPRMRAAQRRGR